MDNLPKIAVLARLFPNIVQTYIVNHITGLIDLGVDTTIIAEKNPGQSDTNPAVIEYGLLDRALYAENSIKGLRRLSLMPANLLRMLRLLVSPMWFRFGPLYTLKAMIRVSAITRSGCSLMHVHSFFTAYHFLFAHEYLGIPMVVTYHGKVPRGVNKLSADKTAAVIERSDRFVVNTGFARDELLELDCDPDKIHIIPQGTDIDRFRFRERSILRGEPIRLLTVARLSAEKGHATAISAIAELIEDYGELEYHIIGDGPERDNILQQAQELGIGEHIVLHDFMTGDSFLQKFDAAHIFLLPSIDFEDGYLVETQGVVLQEAQSCGIPIVGSDAGGIPDVIIDGETGLVFPQENHLRLAACIRSLVDDEELYTGMCTAGRRDVEERYSIGVVCGQLIGLYESLLGRDITATRSVSDQA